MSMYCDSTCGISGSFCLIIVGPFDNTFCLKIIETKSIDFSLPRNKLYSGTLFTAKWKEIFQWITTGVQDILQNHSRGQRAKALIIPFNTSPKRVPTQHHSSLPHTLN